MARIQFSDSFFSEDVVMFINGCMRGLWLISKPGCRLQDPSLWKEEGIFVMCTICRYKFVVPGEVFKALHQIFDSLIPISETTLIHRTSTPPYISTNGSLIIACRCVPCTRHTCRLVSNSRRYSTTLDNHHVDLDILSSRSRACRSPSHNCSRHRSCRLDREYLSG